MKQQRMEMRTAQCLFRLYQLRQRTWGLVRILDVRTLSWRLQLREAGLKLAHRGACLEPPVVWNRCAREGSMDQPEDRRRESQAPQRRPL